MFIERVEKDIAVFDMDNIKDMREYKKLINNPAIRIVSKVIRTIDETSYEGEVSSSITKVNMYVEYEQCGL